MKLHEWRSQTKSLGISDIYATVSIARSNKQSIC